MSTAKIFAAFLVGTALLGIAFARVTLADATTSASGLTGTVTSQADGPMEGVLIGAKRDGSTISTWVVSNAQGQYSFPRDRMEPGRYAISIRAVGYELPATSVDLKGDSTRLDLPLTKITRPIKIATQMSNAELIMSASGTPPRRRRLADASTATRCSACSSRTSTRSRCRLSPRACRGTRTTPRRCIRGSARRKDHCRR